MVNLLFLVFVVIGICIGLKAYYVDFQTLKWRDVVVIGMALVAVMLVIAGAHVIVSKLVLQQFWRDMTNVVVLVALFFPAATALYTFAVKRAT